MADKQTINALLDALQMEHQATPPANPSAGLSRLFLDVNGDAQLRRSNGDIDPVGAGGGEANADFIFMVDDKSSGTDGGTFTSGAWRTRDLTAEYFDEGNHASLSGNQITLAAGSYRCLIIVPAASIDDHKARLYNVSDSIGVIIGSAAYASNANDGSEPSIIAGTFTIAAPKIFEVRHRCGTTQATFGFGRAVTFGLAELYTQAMFWRVD